MMWEASAPSNIALIKYMGKTLDGQNTGTNPSLSLTLPHLRSTVVIEKSTKSTDEWQPLDESLKLSEFGQQKFLKHFLYLKQKFALEGQNFKVLSKNNFPADCGIASSASSFAALTRCAVIAFSEITQTVKPGSVSGQDLRFSTSEQASLSRRGSGSSCRSFFEGFVEWDGGDGIHPVESLQQEFWHQVFIVSDRQKEVSSSQAHLRVATSLSMNGRTERARLRLASVKKNLSTSWNWRELFDVCWAEFWDMHALFETAQPPFGYFTPQSLELLFAARDLWREQEGPLVTMDAGPNVHLIWQKSQKEQAQAFARRWSTPVFSNMEEQ